MVRGTPFPSSAATGEEKEENYGGGKDGGDDRTKLLPITHYKIKKLKILGFKEDLNNHGVK